MAGGRILIIDDEPNIRETMRLALESAGYTTGTAADGAAGLEAFGSGEQWDLVLLDQRMPGMDGLEVLRRIRKRAPHAEVIMVTAFATVELAVEAMKAGALDFLRKPFTPDVLRQTVAAGLERRRARGVAATTPTPSASIPLVSFRSLDGYEYWPAPDATADTGVGGESEPGAVERTFVVKAPQGPSEHCTVVFTRRAGFGPRGHWEGRPVSRQDLGRSVFERLDDLHVAAAGDASRED